MLQSHCCNGKVNLINLNTKRKHGVLERLQNIVLSKMDSLTLFLSDYTESAYFKQKEEAIMRRKFSILMQP